jgi:hypothetical protein
MKSRLISVVEYSFPRSDMIPCVHEGSKLGFAVANLRFAGINGLSSFTAEPTTLRNLGRDCSEAHC